MKKQKRQYYQLEANILRTRLELEYVMRDRRKSKEKNSWLQRFNGYIPVIGSMGRSVLTHQMVLKQLTPLLFSFLLSRRRKSKKADQKFGAKLGKIGKK